MAIDFVPQLNSYKPVNICCGISQKQSFFQRPTFDVFIKTVKSKSCSKCENYDGITISQRSLGKITNGEETILYTITNKNGASVDLSTFGATITSINIAS